MIYGHAPQLRLYQRLLQRTTVMGFFFRRKGSNLLPPITHQGKRVQLCKTKGGKVCKEFPNAKIASEVFQIDFSAICRWCRGGERTVGYCWRYEPEQTDPLSIPMAEKVVGKRLRIRKKGQWIEGKLTEYCSSDGSHSMALGSGDVRRIVLSETEYEWKNDQGQKAIEKLDLETGQVLETFGSITTASKSLRERGSRMNTSSVVCGWARSCGGFFWRYKGSTALPRKWKTTKAVEQLCLKTGRVMATHKSISDARRAVGISTPRISLCCNDRGRRLWLEIRG